MRRPGPWVSTCAGACAREASAKSSATSGVQTPHRRPSGTLSEHGVAARGSAGTLKPRHSWRAWLTENRSPAPLDTFEWAALKRPRVVSKAASLSGVPGLSCTARVSWS